MDIEALINAAQDHGAACGDFRYQIGDLEDLLRAAWDQMSAPQRAAFGRDERVAALFELPEYERLEP